MINLNTIIDLIWLADKILLAFAILSGAFIVVYFSVQRMIEIRRDRATDRIKRAIQRILAKGPAVNEEEYLSLINSFTVNEFFEVVKSREALAFKKIGERFKERLFKDKKLAKIENMAKRSLMKWRRIKAIITLGYIGSPSSLTTLKETLLDKDEDVSYYSMLSLGQIKDNLSAEILLNFLEKRVYSGYKIISVLEGFPPTIVEEGIKKTESIDAATRFWAVKLLTKFKPKEYRTRIEKLTADTSPDVRAAACEFLGELRMNEAKKSLLKCLKDKRWFVRMHAVKALYNIFGEQCLPDVIHLIVDSSPFVKESVKDVMIHNIEKALPYIESCLIKSDDATKKYCVDALIDSMYVPTLLQNVLSDNPHFKKRAIELLDALIKSGIYFGLKKAIDNFNEKMRERILSIVADTNVDLVKHMKESEG